MLPNGRPSRLNIMISIWVILKEVSNKKMYKVQFLKKEQESALERDPTKTRSEPVERYLERLKAVIRTKEVTSSESNRFRFMVTGGHSTMRLYTFSVRFVFIVRENS